MAEKDTAIMGLGNPLMSDEGVGVYIVDQLQKRQWAPKYVELLDMGTAGVALVHAMAGRKKVIFIDCAMMGEPPGTLRRFTPDQVVTQKVDMRMSLHEGDLLNTIELAKKLDDCPEEIIIFGIEPGSVEPGQELTAEVAQRVDNYIEVILNEFAMRTE